jgi:WD40 repeat protein
MFPNRRSLSYCKTRPNKSWGRIRQMARLPVQGRLITSSINQSNHVIAATTDSLIYFADNAQSTVRLGGTSITLIQCSPVDFSSSAFLASDAGHVFHYTGGQKEPTLVCRFHRPITDLSINPLQPACALTAQGKAAIHHIDMRDAAPTAIKLERHTASVAFAPSLPFVFATGQCRGTVALYDHRSTGRPLAIIEGHDSQVTSLKWSTHSPDIVASASTDMSVVLWSVNYLGGEGSNVFAHNGHVAPIVDFDWCNDVPWTLASVSEDNVFEIWAISQSQLTDYLFPQ